MRLELRREQARASHDAAVVDGELWVGGGWRIDRKGDIPHLRFLAWDHRVLAFSAHDVEAKVHLAVLTLPPK